MEYNEYIQNVLKLVSVGKFSGVRSGSIGVVHGVEGVFNLTP